MLPDGIKCRDITDVDLLFKKIFVTLHYLEGNVEFGNPENIGKGAVRILDAFHSQFQLKTAEYRDNNNFLKYNSVLTFDDVVLPYIYGTEKFFKLDKGPSWVSDTYNIHHNTSYTGKEDDFEMEENGIIFGAFFFLSPLRAEHQRKLYSYLDILQELGGLQAGIFAVFGAIGTYINTQWFMGKIISELQYVKLCENS